ncbi:ImmA/IrrE family metallo-endopeptidase [Streptococcus sp. 10F2]
MYLTEKDAISQFRITIRVFNGDLMADELRFYDPETNIAFLTDNLSRKERLKILLHELGHTQHTSTEYKNARIRCENEADRCIIHHLVKDAVFQLDDAKDFNYLKFMGFYNFKTMTEEIMVKDEYQNIIKEM